MEACVRKVVPVEQCIVVLDTSPARGLAHAAEVPAWVATYAEMSKEGYAFSLSDGAVAELISQHARGAITDEEFTKMLNILETFLNPQVRVLLGKKDIQGMIGEQSDESWTEADSLLMSRRVGDLLKDMPSIPQEQRISADDELDCDRSDWKAGFAKFDEGYKTWLETAPEAERGVPLDQYKHPYLNVQLADFASKGRSQNPLMSERADLQLRYLWRQWVRTRLDKHPYNPEHQKKRNDGIDYDLYGYLMLPAFLVADEAGYFERIRDINSPQLAWIWRPQDLADAWNRGERPRPEWRTIRSAE